MGLFDFITAELKAAGLNVSEVNKRKNKDLKYSLVNRALSRYLETEPKESKAKTFSYIREQTGLKFSNKIARQQYANLKQENPKPDYASRLKPDYKPNIEKLKHIANNKNRVIGSFVYWINLYSYDKDKKRNKKTKQLPKSAIRISNGKYNRTSVFTLYTDIKLSKNEVNAIILSMLKGENNELLENVLENVAMSDPDNVLSSLKLIGFKYMNVYVI